MLNSITASDLTALSNSTATVCSGPRDMSCLDSPYFSSLESLHRGALNHDEQISYGANVDSSCTNMLDSAFYSFDLSHINVCGTKGCGRPSKRLKIGLTDSFINDVSVSNLPVDFGGRLTHCITGATMAVSVRSGDPNGFISSHLRHHQHTAL